MFSSSDDDHKRNRGLGAEGAGLPPCFLCVLLGVGEPAICAPSAPLVIGLCVSEWAKSDTDHAALTPPFRVCDATDLL